MYLFIVFLQLLALLQKVDEDRKRKEEETQQSEEELQQKLAELQRAQNELYAQNHPNPSPTKSPRTKGTAGLHPRSTPFQFARPVATHGGIVKPFKAPAQSGPSGVEYFQKDGKNYTTIGQLQAALRKGKK